MRGGRQGGAVAPVPDEREAGIDSPASFMLGALSLLRSTSPMPAPPHPTPLRARLGGEPALGAIWVAIGSPSLAEIAARSGPDAVVIDLQHGTWDRATLEAALGLLGGVPAIVRTADGTPGEIGRALDAGAEGVLIPLVETAAQAAEAVAAARFPPGGTRSGGGVRPLMGDFARYCAAANASTLVGVMIETARGVGNAPAIAATPGIDLVFIGTGDLALSLGCFPAPDARHEQACRAVLQACRQAGTPCGIFTGTIEAALARAREGYDLAVIANDIGVVAGGFGAAVGRFEEARAPKPIAPGRTQDMAASTLADLAVALASGAIEVVDLTQTLSPGTPVIQLPPPMAPSSPFKVEPISRYDEGGPAWYWNNISMGEHTGTHFDAPVHWITGKDYVDGHTDTLPVQRFVAPACVIDCTAEVARDEGFVLEPSGIEAWEATHGRIPAGAFVLMRTDWSKRTDAAAFINAKEDGPHSPGPSAATMRLLLERDVNGWGVEAVGTDAGQAFGFDPPFPAHTIMHGAKKIGLASLANLDRLPAAGVILIAAPLKIEKGSGSPLRVLALVPRP